MAAAGHTLFRTLILDDDVEYRQLLRARLARDGRFTLVADAGLRFGFPIGALRPHLILVDPVIDGQLDMRYLRLLLGMAQQAHVVVCTASWEAAALDEVLLLGVRGFLPKLPEPTPDLCDELAVAGAGRVVVLAVSIVEAMRTEFVATRLLGPQVPVPALDPLERRVLHGLVSGQSTKAIAAALSAEGTRVSARTVQRISERVQHRLGVHTICQLGAEAVRRGIV